jgi:hypothetical protein
MKYINLLFEFVATDVSFVKYGISGSDFTQKIAAGQTGLPEYKIKRMVGGNAVESIEFDHLVQWNQIFEKRTYIVIKFTQIDIDSLNNPVQQFFQFFHDGSL